tara:strand:+ start:10127 stop:12133 length:2007 start_codon:yes stop_codon:yes gene_type:complete
MLLKIVIGVPYSKVMLAKIFITFFLVVITLQTSCVNVKEFEEEQMNLALEEGSLASLRVSKDFKFRTHKEVNVILTVPDFLKKAVFKIFAKSGNYDSISIGRATFDTKGYFEHNFETLSTADSIIVYSDYVGLLKDLSLPIVNGEVRFDYRDIYESTYNNTAKSKSKSKSKSQSISSKFIDFNFTYLGSFDSKNGVPDYLEEPDIITSDFLDEVNVSFPDNSDWDGQVNPKKIMDSETQLVLTEEAEVWVTFVSEGTKKTNAIGYYSYNLGDTPETIDDLTSLNIIFPNTSFSNKKGGLVSGDKVSLGRFTGNTVIGWFLVRDGYKGNEVKNNKDIYFSNPDFNENKDSSIPNHTAVVFDNNRKLALFGYEDLEKKNTINDYNDVIFYVKTSPENAISIANVTPLGLPNDEDGDGVEDGLDNYPNDATKAFNNYAPSATTTGKLLFEDLWPSQGDYDFNDLVVDYRYNLITNSNNRVTHMDCDFLIENIGGSLQNGFAITLPISPSLIAGVDGQINNGEYAILSDNGTEQGTLANETVVFIAGNVINMEGDTINVTITFNTPIDPLQLGEMPFNPFLIVNGDRAREVHLPDYTPTSKAGLLNSFKDRSDPNTGTYYKGINNLPWALNIYDNSFVVPFESIPITKQYTEFANWANSSGVENKDWFIKVN